MGTLNRYGRVHKGHYEPWLTQHINDLRASLGLPFAYHEPGAHKHSIHLRPSNKSFGISPMPLDLMQLLGIQPAIVPSNQRQLTTSLELATLVILTGSTLQETGAQYKFISKRQKAAHAILPVHTRVEYMMFNYLSGERFPEHEHKQPDFEEFTRIWSFYVDGKHIFYKIPEHLRSRYNVWKEYENINVTVVVNKDAITAIDRELQAPPRKRRIPQAQLPNALKPPRVEQEPVVDVSTTSILHQPRLLLPMPPAAIAWPSVTASPQPLNMFPMPVFSASSNSHSLQPIHPVPISPTTRLLMGRVRGPTRDPVGTDQWDTRCPGY